MSCVYVSAQLRVCSSRALSRLHVLFRVGAWCSDPGTLVLSFGFVSGLVWTLALHVLSRFGSMRSRVRSGGCSSVYVCCVLCCVKHAVRVLSSACVNVMSCAVWHAACVFHERRAFMSCVNTWLMSIALPCPALLSLTAVLFFPYRGVLLLFCFILYY